MNKRKAFYRDPGLAGHRHRDARSVRPLWPRPLRLNPGRRLVLLVIAITLMAGMPVLAVGPDDAVLMKNFNTVQAIQNPDLRITSIEDGAYLPANYFYPLIEWKRPKNDDGLYLLSLKSGKHALQVMVRGNQWRPEGDQFKPFLADREFSLTVYGKDNQKTYQGNSVRVFVSDQPIADRIIYRMVEPLFNVNQTSAVRIFTWGDKQQKEIFSIPGTCIGCHHYTNQQALFNAKKAKDRRWVLAVKKQAGYTYQQRLIGEFSFLSISGDQRYAALVLNSQGNIDIKKEYIEPFDLPYQSADIFVYDFSDKTLKPLEGASELDVVEDMPCFSADGKYLFFTRYQYDSGGIRNMDLYRVLFNQGRGGNPVPVRNASSNGQYHYFAKCSPDGKWISFCKGNGRLSMFARKSSDIYLLSADEKKVIKLSCNKEDAMDSWHAWSSDSHWLVFASNREDNRLTSLYLTHIDEEGRDTPPVKLMGYSQWKINLPQFILDEEVAVGPGFEEFIQEVFTNP